MDNKTKLHRYPKFAVLQNNEWYECHLSEVRHGKEAEYFLLKIGNKIKEKIK